MRRTTRYLIAATTMALATVAPIGMAGATTDVAATQLTFAPDPPVVFDPLAITVDVDGCTPGDDVHVALSILQWAGDAGWFAIVDEESMTADANGDATAHLETSVAYPGTWEVVSSCDGAFDWTTFEIDRPDDFVMTTTATSIRLGEPFSFEVSGAACGGVAIEWEVALHPVMYFADGTVTPDGNGDWSTIVEGTAPTDYDWDSIGLGAACVFEDGIRVHYDSIGLEVHPVNATPPTPPTPLVVAPRFTG